MFKSISTTSGRSSAVKRTPSSPFDASPTTWNRGLRCNSSLTPLRSKVWSSTSRILIGAFTMFVSFTW